MREYLLCAFAAATLAYLTTPLVRAFAVRVGAMAEVRDRDIHKTPTPRFGGLAILIGVLVALLVATQVPRLAPVFDTDVRRAWALVGAMVLLAGIGLLDDRWGLDALTKLSGQILAGGIIAYGGITIAWIPLGSGVLVLDPVTSVLVTVFIVVFTVNALNFVDGLDGLAAGIAAIAALGFFAYSYLLSAINGLERAQLSTLISVILVGACLGFLPHNFFRARVFMGDTGSMLVGLLLAVCSIVLIGRVDPNAVGSATLAPVWLPTLVPVAVMAVPIADMGLAVLRRTWAGRSPFAPDKEHLHHRTIDLVHSHRRAVLLLYCWAAAFAAASVAVAFVPLEYAIGGGLALLAGLILAVRVLRVPLAGRDQPEAHSTGSARLRGIDGGGE